MSAPANRRRGGRRVSRRTYAVRRVVALGLVLLVGVGLVRVAAGAISGDDAVADADAAVAAPIDGSQGSQGGGPVDAANPSAGASGDPSVADPAATDGPAATDAPATTDAPVDTGPPTATNPAKVFIVGDSDAGTFGPYLQTLLDGTNLAETELDYKVSSGLARPDFFDWPAELEVKLPAANPDVIVATFGGNDSQGLSTADGTFIVADPVADEAEWTGEYQRRVGEVMDMMLDTGAKVIWVGIPNDDSTDVTARLRVQDQAVRAAAAERPDVVFIDTWKRFSGRDGGWAEFVIDPRDGQGKDVRADDGFHLNTNGAEILALDIAQAIRDELRARGAAI